MKNKITARIQQKGNRFIAIDLETNLDVTEMVNNQQKLAYGYNKSGYVEGVLKGSDGYKWRVMAKSPESKIKSNTKVKIKHNPSLKSTKKEFEVYFTALEFDDFDEEGTFEENIGNGFSISRLSRSFASLKEAQSGIEQLINDEYLFVENEKHYAIVIDEQHPVLDEKCLTFTPVIVKEGFVICRLEGIINDKLRWKDSLVLFPLAESIYLHQFDRFGGLDPFVYVDHNKIPLISYEVMEQYIFDHNFIGVSIDEIEQFGSSADIRKGIIYTNPHLSIAEVFPTPVIITQQNLIIYDPRFPNRDLKKEGPKYISIPLAEYNKIWLAQADKYDGPKIVLEHESVPENRVVLAIDVQHFSEYKRTELLFLEKVLQNLFSCAVSQSKKYSPYFKIDLEKFLFLAK